MRRKSIIYVLLGVILLCGLSSCRKEDDLNPSWKQRKLLLMYCDGYNNLTGNMEVNIKDICTEAPAKGLDASYKLLIFTHFTKRSLNYTIPCTPVLMDVYRDEYGNVVCDTLNHSFASELGFLNDFTNTADADCIYKVWEFIDRHYPSGEYGMLFSSHGTGWLPEEYYSTKVTDGGEDIGFMSPASGNVSATGRRRLNPFLDGEALVKSVGCQGYWKNGDLHTHEIEITAFAKAFPVHLKYIIFDACLMGGVETFYQLRNTADYVVASCEEVYVSGFYYKTLLSRVFYGVRTDLAGVCDDYVSHSASATAALVDCSQLDNLAAICKALFEKYRAPIAAVDPEKVQKYFTYASNLGHRWWFYDMEDILLKSGISGNDAESLAMALDRCVVFKKATRNAIGGYSIEHHCGMSMYLPCRGDAELNEFYKRLDWNGATSLVR